MITIDYHTHHYRCGHAQGNIEDYIKAAINKGLTEIGISDHAPIYWMDGNDPLPTIAMAKNELDGYVEEVLKLKEKYAGQIAVRLGIESDYIEDMDDVYAKVFEKYPFDYVLGSVHHVFKVNVFERSRWSSGVKPIDMYREYYRLVAKSARTGLFDILSHTSAILAYAPQPFPVDVAEVQDEALVAIAEANALIEVNTSGYRKMNIDPFPTARMVEKAAELGIPMTFSSDSHRPDDVGYWRDKVEAILVRSGVTQLATFANRQRIMLPFAATTVLC